MGSVLSDSARGPNTAHAAGTSYLDELQTLLTVRRDDPRDFGDRHIYVRVDQGPSVPMRFGETSRTELHPGRHHLHVHNTLFWKHVDFTIETGEHLEFLVINEGRWWTAGVAGLLGAAPLFLRVVTRSLQ